MGLYYIHAQLVIFSWDLVKEKLNGLVIELIYISLVAKKCQMFIFHMTQPYLLSLVLCYIDIIHYVQFAINN